MRNMSYDEFKLLLDDITFRETHKFDAFPISSDECVLYNIDVHTTTFIDGDELSYLKLVDGLIWTALKQEAMETK